MNSEIILPTNDNTSTLALMYYDPDYGALREIDENDIYLEVAAFESSVRRFYLVGELLDDNQLAYKITVRLQTPQRYNYEVRVLAGEINPRLHQFEHTSNVVLTSYSLASNRFANAIPVDILLTSKNDTEALVVLDIEIDSLAQTKSAISCYGSTTSTGCIELNGNFDIELNGEVVATDVNPSDIMDYLNGTGNFEVTICEDVIGTNYFGISVQGSGNSQGSYSLLKDNNLVLDSVSTEDLISYFTSNGYNIKFFQEPL